MQENPLERRRSIGRESFTGIDIPADIFMLDVSADETRMAVIYKASSVEEEEAEEGQERYMLILYDLPTEANGKKAAQNKEFKERDVSFIMTSTKPTYIFLSCSGQSGYVALSFMEIHFNGQPTNNPSDLLSTCYIYGNRVSPKEITFQGRAVFTKTKLALVGCNTVDIYSVFADNVIKKVYTLDIEMLSQGYEAATYHSDFIKELSWAKLIPNGPIRTISVAGHCIITMSRLIRYNILITQYGDCNGGIVRIWSIIDGTLLISYRSKNVEHVLAISDNYRYIATYNEDDMTARIYCTKTSVVLHTIPIRTEADRQDRYTPSYMRFFGDGRYLIISGFEPNTEPPLEYRNYCFDFWCVPAHKLLLTHETRVYESALLPFVMEFQNSSSKYAETTPITNELKNGDTRKLDRHYNLAEVRAIYTIKTGRRSTLITTKTLFEQDGIYSLDKIPWNWRGSSESDPQETTSCKITLLMKPGERYMARFCMRPELNDPLNEFKNLLCYSIQMGTDYYILRFGLYTVQLWRLIEMGPNASEADKSQKGFQLEGSPYFYKSMEANELVYIRTYKATDYETGLTFKMDWRIRVELGFPKVSFMDETGHIYVEIEHQNLRKFLRTFEKTWPISPITKNEKLTYKFVHVDEIFLPILKAPSVSTNNRFSTIDSTGDSTNSDFHEIESACRELCHINDTNEGIRKPKLSDEKLNMFNKKITEIIKGLFGPKKSTKYFTTISGSETLAMLASFDIGQRVLKYIITTPSVPINISSYTKENNERENVLTVLIENDRDDLFSVFFNRVLTDSYNTGPGNLSAVMDALLYLESRGISELLLNCIKKLSYIPVNIEYHPILKSEYNTNIKMTSLPEEGNAVNFGTLERYTALERIKKYNNALLSNFLFNFTKFKRSKYAWYLGAVPSAIHWFIFGESWTINTTAQLCIVPLYRVNDYKIQLGGNIFINTEKTNNETHQHTSDEAIVSMNKKNTSGLSHSRIFRQGGTVMEVAIHYKWKMFARMRFFVILFVHMIYYISYTAAITFPQELYNYEPGSAIEHKQHFLSIALMFVSVYALLLQEFTEFISRTLEYFSSFYNWVDLAAFALPIVAFVLLLTGNDLLRDVDSIAILVLWAHAILRLRVFRQFGFTLEIIIQLSKKIMSIIGIMILVVFAFTHAFIARLRLFKNESFQEQFQGGTLDNGGNLIPNATTDTIYDVSSSNNFSNVFRAFSMVWFFIFGVFDPINDGDVGDDTMTIILAIVFSFVTVFFFSNMVIALMSSTIEDVKKLGDRAWYFHFATVVAEIETYWCSSREKYDPMNNPSYIYYAANPKTVKDHVESMRAETDRLVGELRRSEKYSL